MANRPVFLSTENKPFVETIDTEFEYHSGFSIGQKRKSISSLHENFLRNHEDEKILEISSKSENLQLGVKLSAFNLMLNVGGKQCSVESAFQASKVFENGGPYTDLLFLNSRDAKSDPRLRESGRLRYFLFEAETFPLIPETYFYDWLYINALKNQSDLSQDLISGGYTAFTDIEFNPKKSINCQARSVAVYLGLVRTGLLEKALESSKAFREIVYFENLMLF